MLVYTIYSKYEQPELLIGVNVILPEEKSCKMKTIKTF